MTQGFATELGPTAEIAYRFGLKKVTRAGELRPIRANAKNSDGTLWIAA